MKLQIRQAKKIDFEKIYQVFSQEYRKKPYNEKWDKKNGLRFVNNYSKIAKIPIIGEKIDAALKKSIEKTIRETSNEDLEILIKKVIRKELRFIEISGGILGGLIGTIQGLLFLYL